MSVEPSCVRSGTQEVFTIRGIGFKDTSSVQVISGGTLVSYAVINNGEISATIDVTSGTLSLRVLNGIIPTAIYNITITPSSTQNVVWTNTTGANVSGNRIISKTSANSWTNCGPYSTTGIAPCGGYMQFTIFGITNAQSEMIGLNADPGIDNNYLALDHAIYTTGTGATANAYVYENGIFAGNLGTSPAGTVYRITVKHKVIEYSRNGVIVLTRPRNSVYSYYVDTSINRTGNSRISSVIISGNLT